jgi:hypothetical protein
MVQSYKTGIIYLFQSYNSDRRTCGSNQPDNNVFCMQKAKYPDLAVFAVDIY